MKKEFKKVLALLLVGAMVLSMAACGKKDEGGTSSTGDTGSTSGSDTPLVVGYSTFSQKFSPFYSETAYDQDAVSMTQISLMTTDRLGGIIKNAIEGETVNYNGTDYTYTGPADIDWKYDETTDTTTYTAKIRDDLKFSDGEAVTADDLIFTYYVYLDNSYVGSTTINSNDIVGLANYQLNSTAAEGVTVSDKEIADLLKNPSDDMKAYITDYITNILTGEKDWCTENWESYKEQYKCNSAEEFFVILYSLDDKYEVGSKDFDTVVSDVIAQYGTDYATLANNYAGDPTYFDGDMTGKAEELIKEEKVAKAGGDEVPNITGITKVDDQTVQVVTNGFDAAAVYTILGIYITPMHYYGDASMYDYDNNQFGFTRGDLKAVESKMTEPMGAGAYIFKEYKNKTIYYEANPNFYKGEPKIKNVQFKEVNTDEIASDVESGTVDCGEMTGSTTRFQEVQGYNSNGDLTGDVITTSKVDNLGYGYIGINSTTVNVGGKQDSEKSEALRKGIMTVLSVYRDTTVDTYYGEAASVINYPISNTSWAAPQATDDGYAIAYSKDVDGNDIYTSDMSADDKYKAALDAAVAYFKAAGYTWDEGTGKFTAAPSGAKMSYEVIIPAEGKGDHPSYGVLTDAKAALGTIGIELKINDPADSNVLWDALDAGTQELWCAAWGATIDPDMYQIYYSKNIVGQGGSDSNHYHIQDAEMDKLIMAARQSDDQSYRKAVYKQCFDIILRWAVELPVYQRQNCIIFSTERINMDTVTPDITTFWGWMNDIQNITMN